MYYKSVAFSFVCRVFLFLFLVLQIIYYAIPSYGTLIRLDPYSLSHEYYHLFWLPIVTYVIVVLGINLLISFFKPLIRFDGKALIYYSLRGFGAGIQLGLFAGLVLALVLGIVWGFLFSHFLYALNAVLISIVYGMMIGLILGAVYYVTMGLCKELTS